MNKHQRIALLTVGIVVLLMMIFPPFQISLRDRTLNMGYSFIFYPPRLGSTDASVNHLMLLVQWFGVLILGALACLLFKSYGVPPPKEQVSRSEERAINKAESSTKIQSDPNKHFLVGDYHPWRRFFARTVDLLSLGVGLTLLVWYLIYLLIPGLAEIFAKGLTNVIAGGIVLYIIWLPVEATFLTCFGTTPSKWIFGISVLDSRTNQPLSYENALKRTLLVCFQGESLGIPFIIVFTRFFAYRRLARTGTTLWDLRVGSRVTHEDWSMGRAIIVVIYVIAVTVVMGLLGMSVK